LEDKKSRDARLSQEKQIERERSRSPDIWGSRSGDEEKEDVGAARSSEEGVEEGADRYNESENAVKRRKVDLGAPRVGSAERKVSSKAQKISGPFIDESDSENEGLEAFRDYADGGADVSPAKDVKEQEAHSDEDQTARKRDLAADISPLVREATSHMQEDEYPDFDDIEAGGVEGEGEGLDFECEAAVDEETFGFDANDTTADTIHADEKPTCPVCQGGLEGFDEMVCSLAQAF
jgi:DNA cross-link repair 1A protein